MKKSAFVKIIKEMVLEESTRITKKFSKAVEAYKAVEVEMQSLVKDFVAEKDPKKKEDIKNQLKSLTKKKKQAEAAFNAALATEPVKLKESINEGKEVELILSKDENLDRIKKILRTDKKFKDLNLTKWASGRPLGSARGMLVSMYFDDPKERIQDLINTHNIKVANKSMFESVNEGHYEDYLDKILEYLESALKASQSTKFNAAKWYSTALSAAIGPAHYKKIARKIGILKDIEDATYTKRDSKKIEAIINTLKKHMNESLNEGKYNIEDLKYQFPLSIEGILGINPAAFKSIKKQGKDLKVIMSSYIDSGNMNDLLHHINMALDYSLRIKEGPKKGQNNIYIIGEGFKYIKTFEAANEVATQVPAKMVAFDDEDDDEETMIKKKKMAGPMGMVGYLGVAEDDEEEESEEERIRKREGRVPGPEGGVGYAGKERG